MTTNDVFQPEQVYTVTEVAEWLQVSRNHVSVLAKRDGWPHMTVGNRLRFTASQLKEISDMLNAPPLVPADPRRKIGSRSRQSRFKD